MTNPWIKASLIVNILILVPVCILILRDPPDATRVFGPNGTARQILLCMYLAILGASIVALTKPAWLVAVAVPLLCIQIVYKTLSVLLIADKSTPVLWFNLAVAVLHSWTMYVEGRFVVARGWAA